MVAPVKLPNVPQIGPSRMPPASVSTDPGKNNIVDITSITYEHKRGACGQRSLASFLTQQH